VRYCEKENLRLITWCDSSEHHTAWGSTNCNGRGETLLEFLSSWNLEILNRGNEPTFCNVIRQVVNDITLGSYGLLENIIRWEVSREPSLSDHRHILFTLRGSVPAFPIKNPRGTNWGSFREDLRDKLERGPVLNMEDETGLGLAVQWIQQVLVTAYEENCPYRPSTKGRKSLRWTPELRPSEEKSDGPLIGVRLITSHPVGNSTERLNGCIGGRYVRLPKRPGGPSVAPSMTYLGRLGYIGPYLGTLKRSWDPWWLLLESSRNPRGNLGSLTCYSHP